MLFFITSVGAVFLLHKKTQKLIGEQLASESPKRFTGFNHPSPVSDFEKAIDFKLKMADTGDGSSVIIEQANEKAFDIESGGDRDGLALIFFGTHGQGAQRFNLLLQEDDSFIIEHKKKCVKYSEETNGFSLGQCNDLQSSTFDLYYEVKAESERKLENIYNLLPRNRASNSINDGSYVKSDNPVIMDSFEDKNITDIIFENGKAVTRTDIDKPFDAHIGHSEIKVRPMKKKLNVYRDSPKSGKRYEKINHSFRNKKKHLSDKKSKSFRRIIDDIRNSCDESTSSSSFNEANESKVSRRHQKYLKSTAKHGIYV